MSDHVDGPRSIGDPSADLTDLFAFTSPENPARTVLAACVFPSAGESAMFSNVIDLSIVARRVTVAGSGAGTKFQPASDEIRFRLRFDVLNRDPEGNVLQRGKCFLPGDRELQLTVNDEKGASTPEGDFRVFAGLRSDPFYLAWLVDKLKPIPNLLQHDNVLAVVVEFDTQRVLDPAKGSLFGVVAETFPSPHARGPIEGPDHRIDWIGRPEQTNVRLNNPLLGAADDLRDLWNQQTPFAIARELQPLFLQRLKDSIAAWDMADGKADWSQESIDVAASVLLDDFLLFDITRPITDQSHLEIEKSTMSGQAYRTGGGRTIDANVIDILLTWLVNNDRQFLQGGAIGATKPGMTRFPYLATPNTDLQTLAESAALAAAPDEVWALIGQFGGAWHPQVARVGLTGTGIGQLRTIGTIDGTEMVDRLEAIDAGQRLLRYTNIAGIPASHYSGTLEVKPRGVGCVVEWRVQFLANGRPDGAVRRLVSPMLKSGVASLSRRFGAAQ
jgi:hypothetical protein